MKFNLKLENIKYIKILYRKIDGNPCAIKAAMKSANEREIIAWAKCDHDLHFEKPQEVILSIVCSDGLYRTKTQLKSVDNEYPYIALVLETPEGFEYQQNREYFRVMAQYNCVYKIYSEVGIKEFNTHTLDISANGVSIFMPVHEISNEESTIEIAFNEINISLGIKYVRSEKVDGGFKLSFTYTTISNLDRDFISQVCIKQQLEQKRNSIQ